MGSSVQLILLASILILTATNAATKPKPDCPTTCGNLTIPFPFGTTPDCYLDDSFLITCNSTAYNPPQPFFMTSDIPVLNLSLDGQMNIPSYVSRICYDATGSIIRDKSILWGVNTSSFYISNTRNIFTTVGCATLAVIKGHQGQNYTTGCLSACDSVYSVKNGSCSGIGCCRTSIPQGVRGFGVDIQTYGNRSIVHSFNPCSYAFIVEEKTYNFSSLDLMGLRDTENLQVVLDWAVGNEKCEKAKMNPSSFACRDPDSECIDSPNGPGYRCNCTTGFEGNPYLLGGCKDVNECEAIPNPCGNGTCANLRGNFSCSCQEGYEVEGTHCRKRDQESTSLYIAMGIRIGLLVLVVGSSSIYWMLNKRKLMKLREKFFQQNGGFLLKQLLSTHQGSVETPRIFTAEDLKKATNNYDESRVIGKGGYGTVYKGILLDNKEVAIKKSKISDQSQVEQFINEVVILSKINHRNVVRLIGCCLETEVPLLVYEFIANGTLSDHIHNVNYQSSLSWEMRLKIAAEAAGAVAYLHSETSTPIIHRDIKSTNILLDDNYTPKVSDFGASRLVPLNQSRLSTLVQGTPGYLDPEYHHSGQLTDKSDVYSFGVLLAELLTGKKALSFDRSEKDKNLAVYFLSSMKESCLLEIFEDRLVEKGNIEMMKEVAMLAKRCLSMKGEERPTMKEVTMELEELRRIEKHSRVQGRSQGFRLPGAKIYKKILTRLRN